MRNYIALIVYLMGFSMNVEQLKSMKSPLQTKGKFNQTKNAQDRNVAKIKLNKKREIIGIFN